MVSLPRSHAQFPSRPSATAVCWLFVAILVPTSATAADPRPSPHRHIPAKNLVAYFEFDGLDAHAAAWKRTSAHAALTKTKAGAMIGELARQVPNGCSRMTRLSSPVPTRVRPTTISWATGSQWPCTALAPKPFPRCTSSMTSKGYLPISQEPENLVEFVGLPKPNLVKVPHSFRVR